MARAHGMHENRNGRWAAANQDVPFQELHRLMHCLAYRPLVLVIARVSRHLGECLITCMSLRMCLNLCACSRVRPVDERAGLCQGRGRVKTWRRCLRTEDFAIFVWSGGYLTWDL